MEIIKIGSNSLKISLCTDETQVYKLEEEDEEQAKYNLMKLLIKVKENISFKIAGEKVVAEIFTSRDGGCEIFVSRVEVFDKMYKEKLIEEIVKKPRQTTNVYSFDDLDMVLLVAKRLESIDYKGESSLYYDEDGSNYYIFLENASGKDIKYAFLNEYSRHVKSYFGSVIKEHYKCVFNKNAVKRLSAFT